MSVKRINLALQGGGAHGAFTWGVLDRILEDPEIEIAGVSGCSAGALNTVALKAGLVQGGPAAARENLDWLWEQLGAISDPGFAGWMNLYGPEVGFLAKSIEYSLPYAVAGAMGRMISPYAMGALYTNPLRRLVERFDFQLCHMDIGPRIFIGATNVRTGKIRVFQGEEISVEAVLASACLPTVFQAVPVEDPRTGKVEYYWDGGYTGNPALFPLFEPDLPADIVVVNINPMEREDLPRTPQEILNRINEISFNSSLLRELRAINFVHRLMDQGKVSETAMKNVLVHMIADDDLMNRLSIATKMVPNPYVLGRLKEAGRAAAEAFLADHKDALGQRSTIDLQEIFS